METSLVELVSSSQQLHFGLDKTDKLSKQCIYCDFIFACWGACPKHRFSKDANGKRGLNYLFNGYKKFLNHINWPMRIMAALFNQERAPSEVMKILTGHYEI
jgi:uncharacterized protein